MMNPILIISEISIIPILLSAIAIVVAFNATKRSRKFLNSKHSSHRADTAALMLQIRLDIIAVELTLAHALNTEKHFQNIDVKWLENKLSEIRRQYDVLREHDDSTYESEGYLLDLST